MRAGNQTATWFHWPGRSYVPAPQAAATPTDSCMRGRCVPRRKSGADRLAGAAAGFLGEEMRPTANGHQTTMT
jgi:hypothetical protein